MEIVKKYDFFSEKREDFYKKLSHKSILCQGKHWEIPPFVTILITTYKRPEMLRQALKSALNQKGFDDYQIIVADNEGVPVKKETPTSRLIKEYQNERVIYYRHSHEIIFREDSAIRLARSPWIVILHDDDLLAENHLLVMTKIVQAHKEIKFLGCRMKDFISEDEIKLNKGCQVCNCTIMRNLKSTTCLGNWAGWLGALISRKHYIAIGGMPPLLMGIGDQAMVAKFLHRFGTYLCVSSQPLYFYRRGIQQDTYVIKDNMEFARINEYYLYKYAINKYHKLTHKIWERNAAYITLSVCEKYKSSNLYHSQVNINYIISECGMPKDIQEKNTKYYVTVWIFYIYRKCIKYFNDIYVKRLHISDIYITV